LTSEKELKDFLGIFERCISADEKSIQSPETVFQDREEVGQPASVEIPTLGTQPSAKIACENELKVYINERPAMQIVCTPEHMDELIAGRLLTENLIDGIGDISSLKLYNKGRQARIELSEKRVMELKDREADFVPTCCTDNKLYFERRRDRAPVKPIPWELAWFEKLLEKLREGEPLFSNTRSAHACYLGKNGEALCCREDIGRHNALDKAIGYGLLNGVELSQCYLFTTGRMPSDMVKKAVNAGVPILASKAYPTDRAVEIARREKLTLITFRENGTVLVWSTHKK
jgi:FdhD protein